MITKLSVSNFKSVRHLDIDCKKVNLFIGEPNTGKSNILEALGLLSWSARTVRTRLGDYVRFQLAQNLFYDGLLHEEIAIVLSGQPDVGLYVGFGNDRFEFRSQPGGVPFWTIDPQGASGGGENSLAANVKFFRFRNLVAYDDTQPGSLNPPSGTNLFSVVFSSNTLREVMEEFFRKYGLRLLLRQNERIFELVKQADGPLITYPYALTSDTLQRIIFYTVAIASNKDSVLVFEEPESNAFPYYTKYLGERIALDETNQFFIATHNPYLLSAVVEKARREDVQVFITYFQDYETRVKPLTSEQLSELMEADPFFNLDRFIEEGQ